MKLLGWSIQFFDDEGRPGYVDSYFISYLICTSLISLSFAHIPLHVNVVFSDES